MKLSSSHVIIEFAPKKNSDQGEKTPCAAFHAKPASVSVSSRDSTGFCDIWRNWKQDTDILVNYLTPLWLTAAFNCSKKPKRM